MKPQELRTKKENLLIKFNELSCVKKKLYSNINIESPMSLEEKQLNNELSIIASEINSIVRQIRNEK